MIFLCLTGLDFFGFVLLNIYIGAVSVLFLFIIMIINFRKPVFVVFIDGFFGLFLILLLFTEVIYFFFFLEWTCSFKNLMTVSFNFSFGEMNGLDLWGKSYLLKKLGWYFYEYNPLSLILVGFLELVVLFSCISLTYFRTGFFTRGVSGNFFRLGSFPIAYL